MPRRRYLVTYDIREPKRLRAVHTCMKGYGDPLQYSVFLCDLDGMERIRMLVELRDAMNEREDSIAIVDLGETAGNALDCFQFLGVTMPLPESRPRII